MPAVESDSSLPLGGSRDGMGGLAIKHEMVRASAGTGKTTSLSKRYVRLLAMGANPESIVALTFTRKAAGEFFDRIAELLATASTDPEAAARMNREIGLDPALEPDYSRLLRSLLAKQHQIMLGTLDSFYSRVVRAFPFELGVTGGFQLLEGHDLEVARKEAIHALFGRVGETKELGLKYFLEAFKMATFGVEEVRLGDLLVSYISHYHKILIDSPKKLLWGDEASVWGVNGLPYPAADREELVRRKDAFLAALKTEESISGTAQLGAWDKAMEGLVVRPPGTGFTPDHLIKANVLPKLEEIRNGSACIMVSRKKCQLDAMQCQKLIQFIDGVLGADLRVRLKRAEGIQRLLRDFETIYHSRVRSRGAMSFDDLARLLGDIFRDRHGGGRQQISLVMSYRLDSAFDHWLLDEFQDTSRLQWAALEDLIDEAVQDDSDSRTIFIVGDTKQAIYGWREGDARLFDEVLDRYNQGARKRIAESTLAASYRSARPIIETVNRVFGSADVMRDLFPSDAVARWRWETHVTAEKLADRPGYVEFVETCPKELEEGEKWDKAAKEQARLAVVAERLAEITRTRSDFSCAVLVQDNKFADRALDFLRTHCPGVDFASESSRRIAHENMLSSSIWSLFQVAVHPGDTLAWRHLGMTPLAAVFAELKLTSPHQVVSLVLRDLEAQGFGKVLQWWLDRITEVSPGDAFSIMRAGQIVEAGVAFDTKGGTDPADFLEFLDRYEISDASGGGAVQIMTVHKAKGLDFDMVFLPDLDGDALGAKDRSGGLLVGRGEKREIRWALERPAGGLLDADPVLAEQRQQSVTDEIYEGFCRLYVAMTRARHGLYMVVDPLSKRGSKKSDFAGWLRSTLSMTGDVAVESKEMTVEEQGCRLLYREGENAWFKRVDEVQAEKSGAALIPTLAWSLDEMSEDAIHAHASGSEVPLSSARGLPPSGALKTPRREEKRQEAVERGTQIHALLEGVDWLEDDNDSPFQSEDSDVARELASCLTEPEIRALLTRPDSEDPCELWKERAFDVLVDGKWLSGVIDRAQIHRAADGSICHVDIIDFKSDRLDSDALSGACEQHSVQLKNYRSAVSVLLDLPPQRIVCYLVFTSLGRVLEVA